MLPRTLAACAGFLIGVLWMDLMFDVQVLRHAADVPEPVLASIASYYGRATTDSWPMSALIAGVMGVAVVGAAWQLVRTPGVRPAAALGLVAIAVGLAAVRVVPNAVRLGMRGDPVAVQTRLARAVCRDHLVCLASMAGFLVLQLRAARR